MSRQEIRQAIIIKTNQDPQDNFTVLEKKEGEVKVEIHWTRDESEIIVIKIS